MKKFLSVIMLLFIVVGLTACGSKKDIHKNGSAEDLLDTFISSYNDKDVNKLIEVLPEFLKSEIKYTQEEFKEYIIKYYGEDLKVSYEITEKKKTDQDDLDTINAVIKEYYKSDKTASECYDLEGTISYVSSKLSHTNNLNDIHYCKINDKWYLLFD